MINEILASYGMVLDYARRMVADVDDEHLCAQPVTGINCPAWIIGHLVYSAQMIGGELGLEPWLTEAWVQTFQTGSQPVPGRTRYPGKAALMAALDDSQRRLGAALSGMAERELNAPLPDESCRDTFPTLGRAVLHILTVHTAIHVGQLSVWRRAMGMPAAVVAR